MRKMPHEEFAERILPVVAEKYSSAKQDSDFTSKATLVQERITFFAEAPDMLSFFYAEPKPDMALIANKKQKVTPEIVPDIVSILIESLKDMKKWDAETLKNTLFALAEEKGYKNGQLLWPLRAILTGLPYSPGAFEVAKALGKEETLKRLTNAKEAL